MGSANVHSPCLGASRALQHPRLLPPGYSHRRNSTRGNALWVLQGKQGTRVQRSEGEGVRGGEEEGTHSPSGNLRQPGPPLGTVCWATVSKRSPLRLPEPLLWPVHNARTPF